MTEPTKVEIKENGVYIENQHIPTLLDVKIHSTVENVSEVTLTFMAEIKGLDVVRESQILP